MALRKTLIEHPHESEGWLKLVAYYVEKGCLEEARAQTQKALAVVSFTSPGDKLNVWKGYLNLEFHFGDGEAVLEVYRKACAACGIEPVVQHLIALHTAAGRFSEAEFYAKDVVKRSKDRMMAWKTALRFYVAWRAAEEPAHADSTAGAQRGQQVNDLLRRALQSLPLHKHVELITFYAKTEYQHGNFEAGRINFENLASNFPRRNDLWSVYIDQEVKYTQDAEHIRGIFERVTGIKKNLKQMQSFFNRFLEFEKRVGDAASQEAVLRKAKHFVESYVSQRGPDAAAQPAG